MKMLKVTAVILTIILSSAGVRANTDEDCLEMMIRTDDPSAVVFSPDDITNPAAVQCGYETGEEKYRIRFLQPGTYTYTIYRNNPREADSVYHLTVFVEARSDSTLHSYSVLTREGSDLKEERIVFLEEPIEIVDTADRGELSGKVLNLTVSVLTVMIITRRKEMRD